MATLRPPKEIFQDYWSGPNDLYYEYWSYPEDVRRRLDECTDPNCPMLLNAMYLTVEARRERVQRRRDKMKAEHEYIMNALLNEFENERTALSIRERNVIEQESILRKIELDLKEREREIEARDPQRPKNADLRAQQQDRTPQDFQKDSPNGYTLTVEDGPIIFCSPPPVSPRTPSFSNTLPATPPPTSPPPIASSPPSSPVHSPCHQPEKPSQDAANKILYSCIMCTKPDTGFMIGCQNRKACLSRHWGQGLGGINSSDDAWFHISHLGMTEATLLELTDQNEDWYCPQCQQPWDNTDPDEDTMIELPSPQCQQPMNKYDEIKRRREAEQAELRRQAELRTQAEIRGQAEIHNPKPPTATKRCRQARTPTPKESTNTENPQKKSNRRKQVLWTNPLERAALIDGMRTVILARDQTEQRYVTAAQSMLARGFDRSRFQVKMKWNRAVREEAQRLGVPEDRREKPGMKTITGLEDPAARRRKRKEKAEEQKRRKERKRMVELGMLERDPAQLVAEMGDGPGEESANREVEADGEVDAEGEVDFEEHNGDDDDEDKEEGPQSKRQRFF